jgi:hypothetical protein
MLIGERERFQCSNPRDQQDYVPQVVELLPPNAIPRFMTNNQSRTVAVLGRTSRLLRRIRICRPQFVDQRFPEITKLLNIVDSRIGSCQEGEIDLAACQEEVRQNDDVAA